MYFDILELQAAASRVPTVSKPGSLGNSLTKVLADDDSVDRRTGIRKTCADLDRSKGKERSRSKRCAIVRRQGKSPQNT